MSNHSVKICVMLIEFRVLELGLRVHQVQFPDLTSEEAKDRQAK